MQRRSVLSPLQFILISAAAIHVVLVRLKGDEDIVWDFVYVE